MHKRTDLETILIIGAGPIVIGQACEFDYSGAQACKALREEGYRVVLVNSNPATIMTDPEMADATYVEPITWQTVEHIIAKEKPDAILPTMGGQTALNCALDLSRNGVLAKYGVELIGASEDAIDKAEDRGRFKDAMETIGLRTPKSFVCHTFAEAEAAQEEIGFPALIRPSFTMGGSGGGVAYNRDEFRAICARGFEASPTHELLIEESILGWKEYEMEVVRDRADNCIIVCSIENFDPCGIHTGDSITVAPAQTLTDKEFQIMRDASLAVLREIGVDTGGSNVQFAVNPDNGELIIIEMNPRVSRSSALASKATGFPIAKVAAKLAVGYTLDELRNDITGGVTPISFEPTLDYVVTKIPRFAFEKFPNSDDRLTTQMKSVGEVMAIGRNFQESLQKALRGLEIGLDGLNPLSTDRDEILSEITNAGANRIRYVADAFRIGMSIEEVFELSKIDRWFLAALADLISTEATIVDDGTAANADRSPLPAAWWRSVKRKGFSDARIAHLLGMSEAEVRTQRKASGVVPVYKRVDTCAAEFVSTTAYMYSTYDEECEADPSDKPKVIILGGGPNRIGQGIEFDYCCVHASLALREAGYETIMVNCNPETVSTDYDTSDRLYFEPLTLENVLDIVEVEKPNGVIVHYGGQTPLKLAQALTEAGVPIIGTSADAIDAAEDRERFQQIVMQLGLLQPRNATARSEEEALRLAEEVGYPLMVRPSYVLGGRAMQVVYDARQLRKYMVEAVQVSNDSPVLLDSFLTNADEIDVDCVSDGERVVIAGLMQHIEPAGIHSGDSGCSLPPYSLSDAIQAQVREQTVALARALGVVGLMNVQFAVKDDDVYVLEVNPRASRTVPFVSKACGVPVAKIAARVMAGERLVDLGFTDEVIPQMYFVKEAVLPFVKFPGADSSLGPEMHSTGEVMGIGSSFPEAFMKAQLGAGHRIPSVGKAFISMDVRDSYVTEMLTEAARQLQMLGYGLCATRETHNFFAEKGIVTQRMNRVHEGRPHIADALTNGEIALVINTGNATDDLVSDGNIIREKSVQSGTACYTTAAGALALAKALASLDSENVHALQEISPRGK